MYISFINKRKWDFEILQQNKGNIGGFSSITLLIKNLDSYTFFQYETGIHRVQRIPENENKGKKQTSTVSVLVFPEKKEVEKKELWTKEEIKIETFRSQGPGGQSVNKTDSAVRITHLPTKISASCQEGKNQHDNKKKAFHLLKMKLTLKKEEEELNKKSQETKNILGRRERSQKIRTYHFVQNRITDHRLKKNFFQLAEILNGKFEIIIKPWLFNAS